MSEELKKISYFIGEGWWNIKTLNNRSLWLSDGPNGIRKVEGQKGLSRGHTVKAVCFPTASLMGCSFDEELMYEYGLHLASQAILNKVDIVLGPGINIKRNPRCGRNFEYFSEDPYLTGVLAREEIRGIESLGIGSCLKHYATNQQETARFISNSIVDKKALFDIYLKNFKIALEANPSTMMASYNITNGIHSTENEYLLNEVLKKRFNYNGLIMSDWGAINDPVLSFKAGLDLEMPGLIKGADKMIDKAYEEGLISKARIDESYNRFLELDKKISLNPKAKYTYEESLDFALKAAEESLVLLKNEKILPLKNKSIAVVGDLAKHPFYQGGGSSHIETNKVNNFLEELDIDKIDYVYSRGYELNKKYLSNKEIDKTLDLIKDKDVVIYFMGLEEKDIAEGIDRKNISIKEEQIELFNLMYKVNKNIIVILETPSAVSLEINNKAKAILLTYLGGERINRAILNTLLGRNNPSGRLEETFIKKYEDNPSSYYYLKDPFLAEYRESFYVGYRYYDRFKVDVLYPFGYGLSYSDFRYQVFNIKDLGSKLEIKFKIKNFSSIDGKEVIQVYFGRLNTRLGPKKELVFFKKVFIKAHEEKELIYQIDKKYLERYSFTLDKEVIFKGKYRFYLSKNVNDESLYQDLDIDTAYTDDFKYPKIYASMDKEISREEFEALYQDKIKDHEEGKELTLDSPLMALNKYKFGKRLLRFSKFVACIGQDEWTKDIIRQTLDYTPIRSISMARLVKSRYQLDGIVDLCNKRFKIGMKKIIHGKNK